LSGLLRVPFFLLCLIANFARAQPISFGVIGGIPISPHSQFYGQGCLVTPPLFCGPNSLLFRPYTIGPAIELHSPWRFSVEAGALYQRFHQDITSGWRIRPPMDLGHRASVSASGLLFLLQLMSTFPRRMVV